MKNLKNHDGFTLIEIKQVENKIMFHSKDFSIMEIPNFVEVNGPTWLTFNSDSGNPASKIVRYEFIWLKKNKKTILQLQVGSGRFVKKEVKQ